MAKERIKPTQFRVFDKNIINIGNLLELNTESKEEINQLYSTNSTIIKPGSIISGRVVEKEIDQITVSVNYKSNGVIPSTEFNPIEFKELQINSTLDVMVEILENQHGSISLSYERAKAAKAWNKIVALYDENKPVEGVIISKVKGGLYVDIGITAFLPGSQIDIQRVTDFDEWIGKKVQVYIIKVIPKRGNVIVSRRKYIYEQKSEVRKGILDNLTEGQIISGTVKNITKYGAFVDIGGVDGLLHITDMTWSRIDDPSEILTIGETINVKLLSFDKDNEKISLGLKQLSENPWDQLPEDVQIGSSIKGTIISIKDYGIFVEIIKGVEGLIHISEVSWTDRISDLNKHFKIGQEIEALVVSLERKNRRMSLSLKQMEKSPWDAIFEKYEAGQKVSGKVTNIADFGFFIQLAPGVDGLVHVSDISWTQHIKHPSDVYKKDDIVEAIITDINKQKRKISLSVKALTINPWEKIAQDLPIGSMVKGIVLKVVDYGAFVRLETNNIEAFIHATECSDTPNVSIDQVLNVGDEKVFKVVKVSPEEQKVGLSLKQHSNDKRNNFSKRRDHTSNNSEERNNNKGEYNKGEYNKRPRGDFNNNSNNNNNNRKKFNKPFEKRETISKTSSSGTSNKTNLQLELEKLMKQQSED